MYPTSLFSPDYPFLKHLSIVSILFFLIPFTLSGQTDTDSLTFESHSVIFPGSELTMELMPVSGGSFNMGPFEDGSTHEVKVDSFWMSQNEINWDLYKLYLVESMDELRKEAYAYYFGEELPDSVSYDNLPEDVVTKIEEMGLSADIVSKPSPPYSDVTYGMGTDGFPAVNITHYAAVMFTKWLSVKTGEFYRLPTEAEWEYACRAGANEEYQQPSADELEAIAWHRDNSNRQYQPVGTKEPNAYGLYNMFGNVAEWTLDQYLEDYSQALEDEPAENPLFIPEKLYPRSVRGGSWMDDPAQASCLQRRGSAPKWKMKDPQYPKSAWWHTNAPFVGFRVVKPLEQPETVEDMKAYWVEEMPDYF
jgi:formylglycine-generating enzyme required for sulfatase activity